MTLNSSALLERVRELLSNGAALDERVDTLILRGTLSSAEAQSAWLSFARDAPAPFASIQVYNPEVSGDLAESDEFDADRKVQERSQSRPSQALQLLYFRLGSRPIFLHEPFRAAFLLPISNQIRCSVHAASMSCSGTWMSQ